MTTVVVALAAGAPSSRPYANTTPAIALMLFDATLILDST